MKKRIKKSLIKKEKRTSPFLNTFYQLIADIKTPEEAKEILPVVIPQTEIASIAKKIYLAKLLKEGVSYSKIREELGVSSATISQTAKWIKKSGLKLALNKVKTDEWAEKWASKIKQLFG